MSNEELEQGVETPVVENAPIVSPDETPVVETQVSEQEPQQEVVEQQTKSVSDYNTAFMEAAAKGDFDAFSQLEKELLNKDTVEETPAEQSNSQQEVVEQQTTQEPVNVETPIENTTESSVTEDVSKKLDKLTAMSNQLEALRAQQPQEQVIVPQQPVVETQTEKIELVAPTVPTRPEVPVDPVDWSSDNVKAIRDYDTAMQNYYIEQNDFLNKLGTVVNKPLVNTNLETRLSTIESRLNAEKEALKAEKAEMGFWNEIRSFQRNASDFSTDRDIIEVHKDINSFADKLALANGYTVKDNTPEAINQFEHIKLQMLSSFINGDEQVVTNANSYGLTKPKDFDNYMKIREIVDIKNNAVKAGRLGANAPLYTAYLDNLASTGELDDVFNTIAVEERSKAYKDTADVIKKQAQVVTTISNTLPTTASSEGIQDNTTVYTGLTKHLISKGLTPEDAMFMESVNRNPNMMNNPANLKRFGEIDSKLNL